MEPKWYETVCQWILVVFVAMICWGIPLLILATIIKFCLNYLF